MEPQEFETYCFLRLYLNDFNSASNIVSIINKSDSNAIRFPLLQNLAVTYSRPFSGNHGTHLKVHRLSVNYVPEMARDLHSHLISIRNSMFAHTDLEFRNPKFMRLKSKVGDIFPMSFKGYDHQSLLNRIDEIETLIHSVEESVSIEAKTFEAKL